MKRSQPPARQHNAWRSVLCSFAGSLRKRPPTLPQGSARLDGRIPPKPKDETRVLLASQMFSHRGPHCWVEPCRRGDQPELEISTSAIDQWPVSGRQHGGIPLVTAHAVRSIVVTLIVLATHAAAVSAQTPDADTANMPGVRTELHALVADVKSLASTESLTWAAIGAGMAVAVHPIDNAAKVRLDRAERGTLHNVFYPGQILGATYTQLGLSGATYAIGRATHRPRVARVGFELVRAQAIAEGMVQGVKLAVRRERPDGSDSRSMPSGHAALTLATATVLQRRFGWVRAWPAYAVASYVAASRVTTDKHYVSDVAVGGVIGVLAGRRVTRDHGRLSSVSPVIGPHYLGIVWTRHP